MHKTCSINYGHLADLRKTLPTTDLNKKTLSFDRISPRDFYFFPFFSICTCVSVYQVSIVSDNGLSPILRQAIIWTNALLLSIGLLGTNLSEILIKRQKFSFTQMHLKILSAKWRPFCPGGDELVYRYIIVSLSWNEVIMIMIMIIIDNDSDNAPYMVSHNGTSRC